MSARDGSGSESIGIAKRKKTLKSEGSRNKATYRPNVLEVTRGEARITSACLQPAGFPSGRQTRALSGAPVCLPTGRFLGSNPATKLDRLAIGPTAKL